MVFMGTFGALRLGTPQIQVEDYCRGQDDPTFLDSQESLSKNLGELMLRFEVEGPSEIATAYPDGAPPP